LESSHLLNKKCIIKKENKRVRMEIDSKSSYIQAIKLVQQKQFARANMIFQSLIKNNVTDEQIIYYYGYSLIELNEYEQALKLYRQYLSINSKEYQLLRAFCYAKMGFIDKAVNDWIKLAKDGDPTANYLLLDLKKSKDNKAFVTFLKYKNACPPLPSVSTKPPVFLTAFKRLKPLSNKRSEKKLIKNHSSGKNTTLVFVVLSIIVILLGCLFIVVFQKNDNLENPAKSNIETTKEVVGNGADKTNTSKHNIESIYLYENKKAIEKDLEKGKKYLSVQDYNNALFIFNKIIYSNADEKYKRKCENLSLLLSEPLFNKLSFNPIFNEVIQNPLLYSNLFVQWKGLVFELKDELTFSIMVYSKNPIYIDGIAICKLPNSFPLFVKQQIEIFGKIISVIDGNTPEILIKNIRVLYE